MKLPVSQRITRRTYGNALSSHGEMAATNWPRLLSPASELRADAAATSRRCERGDSLRGQVKVIVARHHRLAEPALTCQIAPTIPCRLSRRSQSVCRGAERAHLPAEAGIRAWHFRQATALWRSAISVASSARRSPSARRAGWSTRRGWRRRGSSSSCTTAGQPGTLRAACPTPGQSQRREQQDRPAGSSLFGERGL